EPKPRAGVLEARLESDLARGDDEAAAANLEKGLKSAPGGFASSAEGRYVQGRLAELHHDPQSALEHYQATRALDPTHRSNMFRLAYTAERAGLDDIALETYQSLARMLPIDRNVLVNLGMLLEDLGRDQDAAA